MSITRSSRLKLYLESDEEIMDSFPLNWPIVDSAAGATAIADGSTPAATSVYNGQLFRESGTDKVWMALKDPNTGTYTKKWLIYPWKIQAIGSISAANSGTHSAYAFTTVEPTQCYNAGVGDINGSGRIVVPIDGIYDIHLSASFQANATGFRSLYISYNGGGETQTQDINESVSSAQMGAAHAQDLRRLSAGNDIRIMVAQTSGIALATSIFGVVELVSPV